MGMMDLLRRIRLTDEERQELMEFRRQALLARMRDISDGCWAARWHHGLEADLYRITFEGASPEYGIGEVTVFERERLASCAVRANCWFSWSEETAEPTPISLDEAKTRYERICPEGVTMGRTVQEVVSIYEKSEPHQWIQIKPDDDTDESAGTHFLDWLYRASETYKNGLDPRIELVRRSDLRFDLRYGECDVRIVEPSWLPKEFPRADDCTPAQPCRKIRRCVACAELRGSDV